MKAIITPSYIYSRAYTCAIESISSTLLLYSIAANKRDADDAQEWAHTAIDGEESSWCGFAIKIEY